MRHDETDSYIAKQKLLRAGAILLIVSLFALFFRLNYLSSYYYNLADEAHSVGNLPEAAQLYSWTIRNHYPGNHYCHNAIQGTLAIADYYHEEEQFENEIQILLQLRASLYAIHSYYQPFEIHVQNINQRIETVKQEILS